jgi:hypothetical protein
MATNVMTGAMESLAPSIFQRGTFSENICDP